MTYATATTAQRLTAFRLRMRHNALALTPMPKETAFERVVLNVIGWFLGY
jgi:hypothetical protein